MKASIDIKALYNKFGPKLAKTNIRISGEGEYYDLFNEFNNQLVTCDGETCLFTDGGDYIICQNEYDEITFKLTFDEFKTAINL